MSGNKGRLQVVGCGARSPQGLNALQLAMAVRAGLLEPRGTSFLDQREQRVGMVHSRFLDDKVTGLDRCIALAVPAVADAAVQLTAAVPLLLCVSEQARGEGDRSVLLSELGRRAGVALDLAQSQLLARGAAGFVDALLMAEQHIAQGAPAVLVAVVDTFYEPDVLEALDKAWRLHQPGVEDGFVPSEGAACLLVMGASQQAPPSGLFRNPPRPIATVRWLASAAEPEVEVPGAAEDDPKPVLAQAWTQLFEEALSAAGDVLRWIYTDVNGELERVREWSRLKIRFHDELMPARVERLPDLMGDSGAARGGLGAAMACALWSTGAAPTGELLLLLSSESPLRSAVLMEAAK